ncbi:MAG: CvpA family protein [Alphaproteobacteria bacterium]|nr:CvpA family protein [Alphaproteobacteria bacterium]
MENIHINGIDIFIGVVLLTSATLAYFRGFIHEMLSIVGWIGAALAVLFGLPLIRPFARESIEPSWAADSVASSVIFLITLIVISLVTSSLTKKIRDSSFNILDRTFGFVFGLARGSVFVILGYICLTWLVTPEQYPKWVSSAKTLPVVEQVSTKLKDLIPEELLTGYEKKELVKRETLEKISKEKSKEIKDFQKEVSEEILKIKELEDTFQKLTQPDAGAEPKLEKTGYGVFEREDLNRLILNSQ